MVCMGTRFLYTALLSVAVCLFSCKDMPSKNHGPIVLGDSANIVTERDPQKLQDLVTDLNPVIKPAENSDTTPVVTQTVSATNTTDTTKKNATATNAKPQAPLTGNGLKADFNEVSILIPNLNAKLAGNPNLQRANGAVYSYINGLVNGNLIKVNGNVTKVSQRYQSVVVVKNELGTLPLESLSTTTAWEPLKGANNVYHISGLDEQSLDFPEANHNTIRNALSKAANRRRVSRKKLQEWENSIRNVHATNQKPLYVTLRSVMWKIDGKDAKGRMFSKQIRVDMPL